MIIVYHNAKSLVSVTTCLYDLDLVLLNNRKMTNSGPSNNEPKWDYTSSRQNLITGGLVVAGNLLVVLLYVLYRTVPSVHQIISGKPL